MNDNESYHSKREQRDRHDYLARVRWIALLVMGVLLVSVGVLVLVGWAYGIVALKSLLLGSVSVKMNAALCFILTGLILLAVAAPLPSLVSAWLVRIGAGLIGLIALATLGQYGFGWNSGFDLWLFPGSIDTAETLNPWRMASDAAVCFVFLATGLELVYGGLRKGTWVFIVSVLLGLMVMMVALASLLASFTHSISDHGFLGLMPMADVAAILFVLLGALLVFEAWPQGLSLWSLDGRKVMSYAAWSILLVCSLIWSLHQEGHYTLEAAMVAARANISKDVSFRKWATFHGGVYVPLTEHTPSNPYLHAPDRDVVTTTGRKLTLMNPAYVMRELQQEFATNDGSRRRLVSLKPLNPMNAADPWQVKALSFFERGGREMQEVQEINGQPYLRLMLPFEVEHGCLKCHAQQGYKLGDIRGGIDTSISLVSFLERSRHRRVELALSYGAIWLMGMLGLFLFYRRESALDCENKKAAVALSESEERFRIAAETSKVVVYEWDLQEGVQWSGNIDEMLGYGEGEFPRTLSGWRESVHPEDRDRAMVMAQAHLEGRVPYAVEYRIRNKDGVYLWWAARGAMIRTTAGVPGRWIGTVMDITEQRKMEELLRQSQKMEAIGTLAGGIAHDFNNILFAILGYTDLALLQVAEKTSVCDYLSEIHKAADRATDLVRQILTFGRKQQQDKQPLQIGLIIKEVLKLLRASIPTTIEIQQEIMSQASVLADPTQIHQLIMNLCTNGYQAMMEHGGVLGVTLREVAFDQATSDGAIELSPGRYVLLSVTDSGCGMNKDILPRIFDPYFTTKGVGKGTGLGLAVVHGIVKDHQGRIAVYSELGHGTTFHVYLPVIEREAVVKSDEVAAIATMAHERVMVVDDESAIRELISRFLSQAGYQVDVFTNGLEAWQTLSRTPDYWDLLITDQTMPEMTGEELAARALEIRPELPIILCSGYSVILKEDYTGRIVYLQKPVGRNALLALVAKVLAGRGES